MSSEAEFRHLCVNSYVLAYGIHLVKLTLFSNEAKESRDCVLDNHEGELELDNTTKEFNVQLFLCCLDSHTALQCGMICR